MSDPFWLSDVQMARLEPFFPKPHGKPRVDDKRVRSGIIINRNGLRWRDAPRAQGPHQTLDSRWKRWSEKGVCARMMTGLAAEHRESKTLMIDATYLKTHRTATSMAVKKGARAPDRSQQGWDEHQAACHLRQPGAADRPVRHRRPETATTTAHGRSSAACRRSTGCSGTAAMTPSGSGKRCRTKGYAPASPGESNARHPSDTTSADTNAATASRSCSAGSRTGGASQPAMTAVQKSSSQPSPSPQPSSTGYES